MKFSFSILVFLLFSSTAYSGSKKSIKELSSGISEEDQQLSIRGNIRDVINNATLPPHNKNCEPAQMTTKTKVVECEEFIRDINKQQHQLAFINYATKSIDGQCAGIAHFHSLLLSGVHFNPLAPKESKGSLLKKLNLLHQGTAITINGYRSIFELTKKFTDTTGKPMEPIKSLVENRQNEVFHNFDSYVEGLRVFVKKQSDSTLLRS